MSHRLIVEAAAERDIDVAYRWYEGHGEGLGAKFLDEVGRCFERIGANPLAYPEIEPGIRRALPHTFPYLVFFTASDETAHVVAVVHAAQDPGFIAQRLDE